MEPVALDRGVDTGALPGWVLVGDHVVVGRNGTDSGQLVHHVEGWGGLQRWRRRSAAARKRCCPAEPRDRRSRSNRGSRWCVGTHRCESRKATPLSKTVPTVPVPTWPDDAAPKQMHLDLAVDDLDGT
jgi:hypothetical protein